MKRKYEDIQETNSNPESRMFIIVQPTKVWLVKHIERKVTNITKYLEASESDEASYESETEQEPLFLDRKASSLRRTLYLTQEELILLHRMLGHTNTRTILETLRARLVAVPRNLWKSKIKFMNMKKKIKLDETIPMIPEDLKEVVEMVNNLDMEVEEQRLDVRGSTTAAADCLICGGGGQIRRHIGKTKRRKTDRIGNQWNTDLAGPFRVKTRNGSRYFQIIQENKSRKGYLHLLKKKSEASGNLIGVLEAAKTIWPSEANRLLRIRMDNGESYSGEVQKWCEKQPTKPKIEAIPPGVSQMGGVYESLVKTMKMMAKKMMLESKLPLSFYGHALRLAMHIRNLLWHPAHGSSPEMIAHPESEPPSIENIHPFGCLTLIMDIDDKDVSAVATPGVYLGVDGNSILLAYDLVSRRVRRIVHAKCYPNIFPGLMKCESINDVLRRHASPPDVVGEEAADVKKMIEEGETYPDGTRYKLKTFDLMLTILLKFSHIHLTNIS